MRLTIVSALAIALAGLAAGAPSRPRPIPRAPSPSSCRSRPADRSTASRASWCRSSTRRSASISSSRTAPAARPATSAPTPSPRPPPDGYTLLVSASVHVINPFLYKNVPYDVVNDFTPIIAARGRAADRQHHAERAGEQPQGVVRRSCARTRRNTPSATTSVGSASHLAIELLKREAGLDTLVVAYKGTAPALTDLMSGQIQLLADPMLSSLPLAQGRQDQGARPSPASSAWRRRRRSRRSRNPA